MGRLILVLALFAMIGCSRGASHEPKGTPTDPVEVCERVADVCRIDGAKLGVCTSTGSGAELVCMSQH